jgi:hypothetical protein
MSEVAVAFVLDVCVGSGQDVALVLEHPSGA